MRKLFHIILLFFTVLSVCAEMVLIQDDKKLAVKNNYYQLQFNAQNGYEPELLTVNGKSIRLSGGLVCSEDGELPKYTGHYSSEPARYQQNKCAVQCDILKNDASEIILKLSWDIPDGKITDIISFTDSPLIRHQVEISFNRILFEVFYSLGSPNLSSAKGEGVFYPDEKRVKGLWTTGALAESPDWRFAWNPVNKIGFGMICPEGQNLVGIQYFMRGRLEGWSGDMTTIRLFHNQLRYEKLPGKVKFQFSMIMGGDPENARQLAEKILPAKERISIEKLHVKKLITRVGGENEAEFLVRNNSKEPQTVSLKTGISWGLTNNREIGNDSLTLAPGELKRHQVSWKFDEKIEWGAAVQVDVFAGSEKIASEREYCGVTNFAPAVGGVGIVNPGNCRQEGSEDTWIEQFRRGYIAVIEYYCWYPSSIFGLAPKEDSWNPHTESQAAYTVTLSKTFLQRLNKEAKENGMYIYAMISGLLNYKTGLKYPEILQYCENGQPSMYNGKIHGDKRYATIKPNAYSEDFAYRWGREMADSVDMFGWGGCRWDWGFLPNAPNDPLHHDKMTDDKLPDWYDFNGTSSRKLFPDPDRAGAKALAAWRRGVEERHPDFIYGTNMHADEATFRKSPEYMKEASRNSMVLFESLLNYADPKLKINTWQSWGKALTDACQRVRPYGAQPIVGVMRGFLPGSVALNTAQYVCFASGAKWWGYNDVSPIGNGRERMQFMIRFSEYYFDTKFRQILPDGIRISRNERILWKQFVYERQTESGREMTIHLINLPESDYIGQRHEIPAVRKNITITLKDKIAEAYIMLPQSPAQAIKLEVKDDTIMVPELTDAAIVLIKLRS